MFFFLLLYLTFCTNIVAQQSKHMLSFVMPCYNCSATMRKSIDSLYQQNLSIPWEVVCTDDGSKDDTLKILREYEKKYDNFRVIVHEHNKGGGTACNTCVLNAKGDLLFRLDSDNILVPNSVQPLIDLLDATGADAAAFQEMRFFRGDFESQGGWVYNPPHGISDLQHVMSTMTNPTHSGNYLYTRRSFNRAGGYPPKHGSDTFCFGFKQVATGSRIAILPGTFYWHYHNVNGYWGREELTGNNQRMAALVMLQFSEVFAHDAVAYLKKFEVKKQDVFVDLKAGKLRLADPKILKHIFAAYDYEEQGNYQKALEEFELAIKYGAIVSERLSAQLQRMKHNIKKARKQFKNVTYTEQ